jgi:hypothetical protein
VNDENRAKLREALAALAETEMDDRDAAAVLQRLVPRWQRAIKSVNVGIGVPCAPGRSVTEEVLSCVAGLGVENGLFPLTKQSFEVANNREWILHNFLKTGYRRCLMLDSDTAIDSKGLAQLTETMERWDAAMVSALVFQRYIGGSDGAYNAFILDEEGNHKPVTRKNLPQSLTAFPVDFCGLAASLINLDKIRDANAVLEEKGEKPVWFKRVGDGFQHYGEDLHFCKMLRERGLDFVVDPRVTTAHMLQERLIYSPAVAR